MESQTIVESTSSSSCTTMLSITNVTIDSIDVIYTAMPGNEPNAYGNFIAIWANADYIPWNSQPLQVIQIPTNTDEGSVSFTALNTNNNSYIIGYAVGPVLNSNGQQQYGNICATVFLPSQSTESTNFNPSVTVENVGADSVSFEFELPDGITPQSNGAWAALWKGAMFSYATPPIASSPFTVDYSRGMGSFNNVVIARGTNYMIAIFMSGYVAPGKSEQTALACSTMFSY